MSWQQQYQDRFYRSRPDWRNGSQQFRDVIDSHLPADAIVLELGAGPSNRTTKYLSERSACVDGLDIDEQVKSNEFLNRAFVYAGQEFPLEDASYDAVVADYVLEHIEKPQAVLAEITRVLRPRGVFLFRTPNLFHYVSLISAMTPHVVHRICRKFVHGSDNTPDPYPTFYRLNTRRRIRQLCRDTGLCSIELQMIEKEPSYLMFSRPAFLVGVAYERLVNSSAWLNSFRVNILGAIRREPDNEGSQPTVHLDAEAA
jgi:ubiquinone/menaquinone biosynthesis C-methylase UbiE